MQQHIQSEGQYRLMLQRLQAQDSIQTLPNRTKQCKLIRLCNHQFISLTQNNLKFSQLLAHQKKFSTINFHQLKQSHEKNVKKFKHDYMTGEQPPKKRRRGYSIDNENTGAYYLNNWISVDDYPCEKPSLEEKTAHIIYQILNQQWTKALDIVSGLPKTPEITTMQFILKGFKSIEFIFNEQNATFYDYFMQRQIYQIKVKNSTESVGGSSTFVNIFQENTIPKFFQIKSFPRKVQCLKINLQFLTKFAYRYKVTSEDDYVKLAFSILGNQYNQEDNPPNQADFGRLLLQFDLKLADRLNFATKLLSQRKRRTFCSELQIKLSEFSGLDNIIFYLGSTPKIKQQSILKICQAYIDKYNDIQTVAYLSYEFHSLKKYYMQYRQLLQFTNNSKELERLDNYKYYGKQTLKELMLKNSKKHVTYFDCLNISEEKITQKELKKENLICEICTKKLLGNQVFLNCGKCLHGGHATHLLKWFQESENCPHIGCACLCN